MAQKVYLFLDAAGTDEMIDVVSELGEGLFTDRIVTDPEKLGTDDQLGSAKLVYDAYAAMQKKLDELNTSIEEARVDMTFLARIVAMMPYQHLRRHQLVYGPIYSSILDPREDTVYFQKDSYNDKFWSIWIWLPDRKEWYWMDTTEPYIDIFWHKSETAALLEAIGLVDGPNWVVMPLDRIRQSVEIAFSVFA